MARKQVITFIHIKYNKTGDNVSIVKDLKVKGSSNVIKQGTKVKGIRLVDPEDGHDLDCKVPGFGKMALKSSVVKKID